MVNRENCARDYVSFIGTNFNGVEIIRELGRGSSSVVFLGHHIKFDREVAVKIIPKSKHKTFNNEIAINVQIDLPHIVPVIQTGETKNYYYIIMEAINGPDLNEVIAKCHSTALQGCKKISLEQTLRCIIPIIDALICIHEEGIVHCDIKPANILIDTKKARVYLSDFGISLDNNYSQTKHHTIVKGSPLFIAPEQITGKEIDHRADIYAIGITMLKMLLGFVPSRDKSSEEVIKRKYLTPETFINSMPNDSEIIDSELRDIIYKSIAPFPKDRYSNALELKQVLLEYRTKKKNCN